MADVGHSAGGCGLNSEDVFLVGMVDYCLLVHDEWRRIMVVVVYIGVAMN